MDFCSQTHSIYVLTSYNLYRLPIVERNDRMSVDYELKWTGKEAVIIYMKVILLYCSRRQVELQLVS